MAEEGLRLSGELSMAGPRTITKMERGGWATPLTQPSPTRGDGYIHGNDVSAAMARCH